MGKGGLKMQLKPKPKRLRTTYAINSNGKRGRPYGSVSKEWLNIMHEVEQIVTSYNLPLTVRQIYYRLIAKGLLVKKKHGDAYLGQKIVEYRQIGKISWDKIVDLGRKPVEEEWINEKPETPREWYDRHVEEFLESVRNYVLPLYQNQEFLIEVWCEHEGLKPLFQKALENYNVTLYFTKGNDSWSNSYSAYQRLKDVKNRKIRILHFSDFDKYGLRMTKNIERNFAYFDRVYNTNLNVRVVRVALTPQQVEEWRKDKTLPDTQLEAIEPNKLIELIQSAVSSYVDQTKYDETLKKIDEGKQEIEKLLENNPI
jgi:hypothetical protein